MKSLASAMNREVRPKGLLSLQFARTLFGGIMETMNQFLMDPRSCKKRQTMVVKTCVLSLEERGWWKSCHRGGESCNGEIRLLIERLRPSIAYISTRESAVEETEYSTDFEIKYFKVSLMRLLAQIMKMKSLRMLTRPVKWRPDLKVWRNWMGPGVTWIRLVAGKVSRSYILQLVNFVRGCVKISRNQGRKGLVLYLKVCNTALMQSLPGGQLNFDSRKIGKVAVARSRDGLPRLIPSFARSEIRRGNHLTIRLWLTFFGVYRVLPCKGKPNFSSVTDAGPVLSTDFLEAWKSFTRRVFIPSLEEHTGEKLLGGTTSLLERTTPFEISSVSSDRFEDPAMGDLKNQLILEKKHFPSYLKGSLTATAHRFSSAYRWTRYDLASTSSSKEKFALLKEGWVGVKENILYNYLSYVPGGAGTTKSMYTLLESVGDLYRLARSQTRAKLPNVHGYGTNLSGRLAMLIEPAGKVRVVALVDVWSQWALRPLHDWVFSILREIPEDGTYDQLAPVVSLLKRVKAHEVLYSYDLSSATDRFPVALQEILLSGVFGEDYAAAWRLLLVGRPYAIPKKVAKEIGISRFLRYAAGQPMGAYSSWAVFTLSHHCLVQFAAQRAGYEGWFTRYALLGDDIVIADKGVARKYRALCRIMGITIGLNKSLVSTQKCVEFAKRLYHNGEIVSGVPMKLWVAAQSSSGVACALAQYVTKGGLSNFVRCLGVGFKAASSVNTRRWTSMSVRLRALLVALTHPLIGNTFAFNTFPEWLWSESADNSHPLNTDLLTNLTPFCNSVEEVVVKPAIDSLESFQEDLFFTEKLEDGVTRLLDVKVNKEMVKAQDSVEKAVAALRHLAKLNIKMNLVQVSAIVTQIWRSVGKAALVPSPAARSTVKSEVDPYRLKVSDVLRTFESLRRLAKTVDPTMEKVEPGGPQTASKVSTTVLPEEEDDEEGGWI